MSLKQRDVTGGDQLWGMVPGYHLVNYLLRIISVPAESFLRHGFGIRYFTLPNYIAGLIVLLAFKYTGVILAAINPLAFFGKSSGEASPLMGIIFKAYLWIGLFHYGRAWIEWNVLGKLRHTYDEGTSWLLPVGKILVKVANRFVSLLLRFLSSIVPHQYQANIERAISNLSEPSGKMFTERFLEPFALFVLAMMASGSGQSTVAIWLLLSIPGINLVTRTRHSQQMDQVYDMLDSYLDAQEWNNATRGEPVRDGYVSQFVQKTGNLVDQSPEVLEVIEKEKPNLAKAIEAMRARQKKPGESPEINHGVKAAIMILVMIGAMGACRQETTKTKEAYEKAIVGRWRVDANFVETGLSEYMKRFDSIAETNPNKEAIPMIKELLRESQKEWVADLNDYWMEFQADGTTRFVQSEDKKEQAGKYTFSPGLDSLYILNENGKKRNLFGIERLSKDELILRWPMGVTATDSVEYLQYKMIRND